MLSCLLALFEHICFSLNKDKVESEGSQAHYRNMSGQTNRSNPFLPTLLPLPHLILFTMASSEKQVLSRPVGRTEFNPWQHVLQLTVNQQSTTVPNDLQSRE